MAISWICPFCGKPTDDDPRPLELSLGIPDSDRSGQFFVAHFACFEGSLHPDYRDHLQDPYSD